MASGNPNAAQVPLWSSSTFNIGINLPGVPSGLGTQQQAKAQQKAPGAGLKAKKQVILEDDDDVSVWCSRYQQGCVHDYVRVKKAFLSFTVYYSTGIE
jgi:hypothetical protein